MSGSIASSGYSIPNLSSQASALLAQQQSSGLQAAGSAGNASATSGATALGALSNNYSTFLTMLMTQLKNQDPSSPMDANQFTQELVQFSGVEQQISTNSSLSQLIQLTQANALTQSTGLVGHNVALSGTALALQNGQAELSFTSPSGGPVSIAVANAAGTVVKTDTVTASAGSNSWSWNGQSNAGVQLNDGAYTVKVTGTDATGAQNTLSTQTTGQVTGVTASNGAVQLELGTMTAPLSNVVAVTS